MLQSSVAWGENRQRRKKNWKQKLQERQKRGNSEEEMMEGRRMCRGTDPCLLRLTWTWELLRDAVREAKCQGAESVHKRWMSVCINWSVTLSRSRLSPVCQIWCVYASVRTQDSSCFGGKRGQVHPEEGNWEEEKLATQLEISQVQIRMNVCEWC